MQTTKEALEGWQKDAFGRHLKLEGDYEVRFEPLLSDGQAYVAVYKEGSLVAPKVPVKSNDAIHAKAYGVVDENGDLVSWNGDQGEYYFPYLSKKSAEEYASRMKGEGRSVVEVEIVYKKTSKENGTRSKKSIN